MQSATGAIPSGQTASPRDERQLDVIKAFVAPLAGLGPQCVSHDGRRRTGRQIHMASVEMIPIDASSGEPLEGDAVHAIVRNLSTHGICLVRYGFIHWPEMAVRLTAPDAHAMLIRTRVVGIRPLGAELCEVGGEFVGTIA
jgi:hypothetical protein